MILVHLLSLSLGAEPISLASPGLSSLNVEPAAVTYYSDHFAQQLALQGVRVHTSTEIGTILGLERQKELLGCTDATASCMAELANALGVDGIITGSLGKFGTTYQVNLKILAARDGRALSTWSSRVEGDAALLDEYARAAKQIAGELTLTLRPGAAVAPSRSVRLWGVVPAVAGAGLLVASGLLSLRAEGDYRRLTSPLRMDDSSPEQLRSDGRTSQNAGYVCLGVGVAALVAAAAIFVFGGGDAPKLTVSAGAEGAAMALFGSLP